MNFLGMGPLELLLIFAIALVVLGPSQLPELARQLGRALGEIRRISGEVTDEFRRSMQTGVQPVPPPPATRVEAPPTPPAAHSVPRPSADDDLRPPY